MVFMRNSWTVSGRSYVLLVILFFSSFSGLSQGQKTEILWDSYGVPHIYAKNNREMYYAFGWAQMKNHANLVLQLYGEARGRAAEYWGSDFIESDKQVLMFDLPEAAKLFYDKQT